MNSPDKHETASLEREQSVARILASTAHKKVVVAGPGTGKTFLFRKALDGKTSALTLRQQYLIRTFAASW
jgi:hypothetical protein